MTDWLRFLIFAVLSALVARFFLETRLVHPAAIFVVWLVAFVWGAGYIAGGKWAADRLVKVWLLTLCATIAFAGFLALALS